MFGTGILGEYHLFAESGITAITGQPNTWVEKCLPDATWVKVELPDTDTIFCGE